MSFDGKVVWITGASSGIGKSLAEAFSKSGATLVLSARREPVLRNVQHLCRNPESHLVLPLDMCEPTAVIPAVNQVLEKFGKIDFLVNNAGISQRALALDTHLDVDRQIMETNYFGPVALTKAVLPSMVKRRSGHIVVISSLLGKFGVAYRTAYAGSKHALHGFFDSLRVEVHDACVKVTVVCPGFIHTNVSLNALAADGSGHGQMDHDIQHGMDSNKCARQILRAIEKNKLETYVAGKERLALLLKRFSMRLFQRVILRTRLK